MSERKYKYRCSKCQIKHYPPTGRNCSIAMADNTAPSSSSSAAPSAQSTTTATTASVVTSTPSTSTRGTLTTSVVTSTQPTTTGGPPASPVVTSTPPVSTRGSSAFTFSFSGGAAQQTVATTTGSIASTTVTSAGLPMVSHWPMFSGQAGHMPPWGMGQGIAAAQSQQQVTPATPGTPDIASLLTNMQASLQASIDGMAQRVSALENTSSVAAANTPPPAPPSNTTGSQATTVDTDSIVAAELARLGIANPSTQRDKGGNSSDSSSSNSSDEDRDKEKHKKKKKGKKNKSGRARTTEDFVVKEVPWPHYGVYKGVARKPADYDSLTIPEFVFGYVDLLRRKSLDSKTRQIMLGHLQDLMEDAISYPWASVRNFHGVLLGEMERDHLSWDDGDAILKLRYKHAHRPLPASHYSSSHQDSEVTVCPPYQKGECAHDGDHNTAQGRVKHACSYCYSTKGRIFVHPEKSCYSKHGKRRGKHQE